jgi:hypothetical protein
MKPVIFWGWVTFVILASIPLAVLAKLGVWRPT